ncbi:MAG: bifunctional tRNA (5-methylaminomethyl-2-thiouridine)(34)-methyltransferase MnmD/FAD-dependent 5-carboxymethylaminomethyl-2-thiouridine(34) oxidoreductase MnmC [Nitrosomonadaceae bacterium]
MSLSWQNGLPFSSRFDDVYFSAESGLEETRHVFLQGNRLHQRFAALSNKQGFTIGETGFGTGLNFLCAWQLFEQVAPEGASLDFFSTEKFPLDADEMRAALAIWPDLKPFPDELIQHWRRWVPGWNRWNFAGGRVRLTLAIGDIEKTLPQLPSGSVDAWFLDGFSPSKNPEMWTDSVLTQLARSSDADATLATYTSAGWVRRGLQNAGFSVEKVPGYGRKREMLRGQLCRPSHRLEVQRLPTRPKTATVIGGGISGCAAAYSLAKRGVEVTLLERSPHLASAASGNSRGILHARFGASDNFLHRFVLASYGHTLSLLDEVMPVDEVLRSECGLLQLDFSPNERKRITQLAKGEWPEHLFRIIDDSQASDLTGIKMESGGLWFPSGGWVVPPALCARLVDDPLIELRLGHRVEILTQIDDGWLIEGCDDESVSWTTKSDVVVVCCAHSALALEQFAYFPLTAVRGQISLLPETQSSRALRSVVCGDGYCAPALQGVHVIGASHSFNDESLDVRTSDHADNLARLSAHSPSLREALGEIDIDHLEGRASVRCSAPGAMPLVGEVKKGLYCSLAHGTRGLVTAGLAGESVAAIACGHLSPLPVSILSALAPRIRVT